MNEAGISLGARKESKFGGFTKLVGDSGSNSKADGFILHGLEPLRIMITIGFTTHLWGGFM